MYVQLSTNYEFSVKLQQVVQLTDDSKSASPFLCTEISLILKPTLPLFKNINHDTKTYFAKIKCESVFYNFEL